MMKNEIGIVTAFFDIDRENFPIFSRSNDVYFSYFEKWAAHLQNAIVVFCSTYDKDRIMDIRLKNGIPECRTIVICVDNLYDIEKEIYNNMCKIEQDDTFKDFRFYDIACSNMAKYDYVMLMKYYFMFHAVERGLLDDYDNITWVDFGFNHGDSYYLNENEFDFTWTWEFKNDFELFCLSDPIAMSVIDSLQFQKDCIQGSVVGCKKECTKDLWKYMKVAMESCVRNGVIDDDQHLLLMMYKEHMERCNITICDWFQSIELTSGKRFTTRQIKNIKGNYQKQIDKWMNNNIKRIKKYY